MGHLTDSKSVASHLRRKLAENADQVFLADDDRGLRLLATLGVVMVVRGIKGEQLGFGSFELSSEAGQKIVPVVHFLTAPPGAVTPHQVVASGASCGYDLELPRPDQNIIVVSGSEERTEKLAAVAMMLLDGKVYAPHNGN